MNTLKSTSFRLAAKRVFLTYAGYSKELTLLLDFLKTKLFAYGLVNWAIAKHKPKELEDDFNTHTHVYIECAKPINTKNPRFFDYADPSSNVFYHCHIRRIRDKIGLGDWYTEPFELGLPENLIDYILSGVFNLTLDVDDYLVSDSIKNRLGPQASMLTVDAAAIRLAKNQEIDKALDLIEQLDPARYLSDFTNIKNQLENIAFHSLENVNRVSFEVALGENFANTNAITPLLNFEKQLKNGEYPVLLLNSKDSSLFIEFLKKTNVVFQIEDFRNVHDVPYKTDVLYVKNLSLNSINKQCIEAIFNPSYRPLKVIADGKLILTLQRTYGTIIDCKSKKELEKFNPLLKTKRPLFLPFKNNKKEKSIKKSFTEI